MDRRSFIGRIVCGLAATGLAAASRGAVRIWRIGYLCQNSKPVPIDLVQAMGEVGLRENVKFEWRGSDRLTDLPTLAVDLVRQRCDLIITSGTGATRAAKDATVDIPIVFVVGGDPVARGLVTSLAEPGGNLTGIALGIYDEKQLQILKTVLPRVAGVAYASVDGTNPHNWMKHDAAKALGVQLHYIGVSNPADFAPFFAAARQAGVDAALVPDVPWLNPHLRGIGAEASRNRMPAIGYQRDFAEGGGLLSYGPLASDLFARLVIRIDRILRGDNPGHLPVEQVTRFELVINMKEARALGLSIPRAVRIGADELIS